MGCCPKPINLPSSGPKNSERQATRWELYKQRVASQEQAANQQVEESVAKHE